MNNRSKALIQVLSPFGVMRQVCVELASKTMVKHDLYTCPCDTCDLFRAADFVVHKEAEENL